jgi:glycosyltransferase involved in cell wall biosynthesis
LIKKQKKIYICERASSHIVFQNEILKEEYNSLGLDYLPIDQWFIDRELAEYEKSDFILVPSNFVEKTFIDKKIFKSKVINFGSYNDSFFPILNFKKNDNEFNILFVGQLSIRKGLHYLIDGFKKFKHPNKKLHIAGSETEDKFFFRNLMGKNNNNIHFYGPTDRKKLNFLYNIADVFVLPSIEEGQAIVTKEASSAGCPLIVTENTGAGEFVNKNNCGFVIPIRNSNIIKDKLTLLADDNDLIKKFSKNSIQFSYNYTWEEYIEELDLVVDNFIKEKRL